MTDEQWKDRIRQITDPKMLLAEIAKSSTHMGVDSYYGDLWQVLFDKAEELSK